MSSRLSARLSARSPTRQAPSPVSVVQRAADAGPAPATKAAPRIRLSEENKREILAIVKAGAAMHHNARYFRERINEISSRIPDFDSYSELVVRDLYDTFHFNRAHHLGGVGNCKKMWLAIFRCWARRNGEQREVVIKFRDYAGGYDCFLERRTEPDWWEYIINIGLYKGVPMAALTSLYFKYKDAPVKTIRANQRMKQRTNQRSKAPALGPALPSDPEREEQLAEFRRLRDQVKK